MTETVAIGTSTCPHDCPSTCALEAEVLSPTRIGRVLTGDPIRMGTERGEIALWAQRFEGVQRGVVIVEGVQPNSAFPDEAGINTLTSAMSPAPYGGAAVHDNHVWIKTA